VTQARAFDFRGRLTKVVLSRDVFASADAQGPGLLQRCLETGIARPVGLQVMLPEPTAGACPPTCKRRSGVDLDRRAASIQRDRVRCQRRRAAHRAEPLISR
jgi:hypothetical protein